MNDNSDTSTCSIMFRAYPADEDDQCKSVIRFDKKTISTESIGSQLYLV